MKNFVEAKIRCSGFYNRQWQGIFYPEELPTTKWFDFYCEHFKILEINATFYKFPTGNNYCKYIHRYIRLHGIPKMFYSNYSPDCLKALHQSILSKRKIKNVNIYFNNTASPAGV